MASIQDMLGFSARIHYDAMNMLLGEPLGYGSARKVYVNDLNPNQVVKIEGGAETFQNVLEWEVWKLAKESQLAEWFAPCRHISPDGRVLIMDRTQQPKSFPVKLPVIFTDLKLTNFGQLGKHFVCHDYGMLRLACGFSTRMRKADWWHLD